MATVRAGDLKDRISIYSPKDDQGDCGRTWSQVASGYANVTVKGSKSPPGTYAVSSPSATFILRRQRIAVGDIISWQFMFYMVTSVTETSTAFFTVIAAMVRVSQCSPVDVSGEDRDVAFEGVLCEKYLKYSETNQGYATNILTAILITPREVVLQPGTSVRVATDLYAVRLCHDTPLGGFEYEIWRTADL